MYEHLESDLLNDGIEPLSLSVHREPVEQVLIDSWSQARSASVSDAVQQITNTGSPAVDLTWPTQLKELSEMLEEV